MAEECKFYYYDKGYCCMYQKSKTEYDYEVNEDWVKKYCWNYNYDSCPYYKLSKE